MCDNIRGKVADRHGVSVSGKQYRIAPVTDADRVIGVDTFAIISKTSGCQVYRLGTDNFFAVIHFNRVVFDSGIGIRRFFPGDDAGKCRSDNLIFGIFQSSRHIAVDTEINRTGIVCLILIKEDRTAAAVNENTVSDLI